MSKAVMEKSTQTIRRLPALALLLVPLLVSQCCPLIVVQELAYRPSPSDPYGIWRALIADSGLLILCGSVDNGRESTEGVIRYYNLALRLEETVDPRLPGELQVVQINEHPSLEVIKGYPSDLCQFDEKRATKRPEETGWTEIFLDNWDDGYVKLYQSDLDAGNLPVPPEEPRVVIYRVLDSDPPAYLLMGRLREGGPDQTVLLILGPEHIEAMW
ncbi:MAG: hypothetical protein V2I51_23975 [Anderseniella sp.]|jgi:hypothetical protein|nr:hypothetical protein [Anderseniella sp.]